MSLALHAIHPLQCVVSFGHDIAPVVCPWKTTAASVARAVFLTVTMTNDHLYTWTQQGSSQHATNGPHSANACQTALA